MTTPNFIVESLLPNYPVLLDNRIGQNFLGETFDLLTFAILQLNTKNLSLSHVRNVCKPERGQAAMNRHTLWIEDRWLQRNDDRRFHYLKTLSKIRSTFATSLAESKT